MIKRIMPIWVEMVDKTNVLRVDNLVFRNTERRPYIHLNIDVIVTIAIVLIWMMWS